MRLSSLAVVATSALLAEEALACGPRRGAQSALVKSARTVSWQRKDISMKQAKLLVLMIAACCIAIPLALVVSTLTLKAADPPGHDLTLDDVGGDIPLYGPNGGQNFIRAWCGCLSHAITIYTDGGSPDPITGDNDVSAIVTYTTSGIKTISVYSPDPHDSVANSPDWFGIYDADEITITGPDLVSVNKAGIVFEARVKCQGVDVSGKMVTFSCSGYLSVSGDNPVATDATGKATVTVDSGQWPSGSPNTSWVRASVDNGLGQSLTADHYLTILKVNHHDPVDVKILVGHLADPPGNYLYSALLTFTVSPSMTGVPITFGFEKDADGNEEGQGFDDPATLENPDTWTQYGAASVRIRSSDMEETATVLCAFQESQGRAEVTFEGITSVTSEDCAEE